MALELIKKKKSRSTNFNQPTLRRLINYADRYLHYHETNVINGKLT